MSPDEVTDTRGMVEFPCDVERLANGHTLIADAGALDGTGSEVVEVDPLGQIVWRYDEGLQFAHSAKRLANGNTLIADTTSNRVIEVTPDGRLAFSSDDWSGGSGRLSDGTHLHYPNDAHELPDGTLIITDRNNDRCVIVDRHGTVVWSFSEGIRHPHNCDVLSGGNVLIADSDGRRVVEIDRDGQIVWSYGDGRPETLNWPRDADRLDNGNTLITDSKNSRILEVAPDGRVAWSYAVPYFANFYDADKLPGGNVLISSQQHQEVIEVDAAGNVVWSFRNVRRTEPVRPRLTNGAFKQRAPDGGPACWTLCTRLSEGGGRVIWDEDAQPRPCPGIEYDRPGALYLAQTIAAAPRQRYEMGGQIRTELDDGSVAYFQIAFVDDRGGYTADTAAQPKGQLFTGTQPWTPDRLEAVAPDRATAAEVRIFISGRGRIWVKGLMVFT